MIGAAYSPLRLLRNGLPVPFEGPGHDPGPLMQRAATPWFANADQGRLYDFCSAGLICINLQLDILDAI